MRIIILIILLNICLAQVNPGGLENALNISTTGVVAQNTRMQVIAQNIANIDATETDQGTPYIAKEVILKPVEYFSGGIQKNVLEGVRVADIKERKASSNNRVYEPDNPQADKDGYVYYPNVDLTQELVRMSAASNAFEANIVVYNTTKAMMQSSLEIGR